MLLHIKTKQLVTLISLFAICLFSKQSNAQLNLFGAMYFQNQYLNNPSMAGVAKGLVINLGYKQQFASIQNAPQSQALTAEYNMGKKAAFGVLLNNETAGILGKTRAMGTYAYHLPLSGENQSINFGLSAGVAFQRLDNSQINGDAGDITIANYNDKKAYFDADFGASYISNALTLQGAIPNLKQFFNKDGSIGADRSTYMAAASYRFSQAFSGMIIEPKAVLRGVQGYSSLLDLGANVSIANNSVNFLGLYHTNQSATFGAGLHLKNNFSLLGVYTTNTADLGSYTNGNFEIALKMNLLQ